MEIAGVRLAEAKVLVVGLARSGLAAIRLLREGGAAVTACDEKSLADLAGVAEVLGGMEVPFQRQSAEVARGHQLVVLSPGVPREVEAVVNACRAGIPVIGDLELTGYFLKGRTVAITGSNGKTTTTSLVGHILRQARIPAQVGGNIGTPPASMVATSRPGQWNVLEVSSFQLETVSRFRAHVAVALNVTPDHLDRHKTFEAYAAAKGRLFQTQQPQDFAVLNADDPVCLSYASRTHGRPLWFSLTRRLPPGVWLDGDRILFDDEFVMEASRIPLRGRHNVQNVLAAVGAARLAGARLEAIAAAVSSFPGVEHRLEYVRTVGGVEYFNDSKATNVDAALKALDAFPGGLWVLLGGKDKDSDYRPLAQPLADKAKAALLIGDAAPKIAQQLTEAIPLVDCGTIENAVRHAWREALPGDVVLLAPACASFDQFDNFEHRGRVFKALVAELEEKD